MRRVSGQSICLKLSRRHLRPSKSTNPGLRLRSESKCEHYRMTREVNTCLMLSKALLSLLALRDITQLGTGLSKMVLLNELIGLWERGSLRCSRNLGYLLLSGVNVSRLWSMSGICSLLLRFRALLPSKLSISENLMSHISGYGGARHMSMYNEISAILSSLTARSVSL
ncbi:hypothetical protein AGABI2DRAFT_223180 [Agaricus bisporus var. bisporus H97]|uniref:hypothetical protein n=1 Tax=Agaricus bisporus var. bisporus (strain H97 / ATCC MYA-4626 / FGSC 10389) TaxID=936046 RepID=UPI00029F7493|nr:hypothetical protein AGABI2DRAFT_223180 [Agaricus bisporus var. bisporus H97]EKV46706.1 hypothetical protein AGABI2DRAFT_223180 [Agaricus bisporus var. bisporus H97]